MAGDIQSFKECWTKVLIYLNLDDWMSKQMDTEMQMLLGTSETGI